MNPAILKQTLDPSHDPSASAGPARPEGFKLDAKRSLRMHRKLAVVVGVLVTLWILAYGLRRQPYYETHALIYVQPAKAKLTDDSSGPAYDSGRYDTYIAQQLQTIVRPDILAEALSKPATMKWRFPGESDEAAIARLKNDLKVERSFGSFQLDISLSGSDPEAIADVVNAVSDAYIRGERSDELAQSDQQLQLLKTERDRIRTSLTTDRQEQAAISAALGVADASGETVNPFDTQLTDLRAQLAAARAAHEVASAQLDSVSAAGSSTSAGLKAAADDISASDPGLIALKQTIAQRRSVLVSQMAGLTPRNPVYKQDEDELKRLDQWLEAASSEVRTKAANQLQQKLRLDANRAAELQSRLEAQLAQQASVATSATPKLQRAADLTLDITRLQAHFTEIDTAINAIELEKNTSGLVHLLLPATPPSKPKSSRKMLILAGALPIGMVMGLLAAVLRQKMDPKVYTGEDVGRVLGFKPMAVLPHQRDVKASVMDEFMLRLVAGVDQAHRTGGARTFVFTAASPGSNISELVASLARKLERFGYSVMVVEAAEILKHVALPKEEMAYLLGDGQAAAAGRAGQRPSQSESESYAIGNFNRMQANIDLLLIEGLPLLQSAETEFAARLSDISILIAESDRTTRLELRNSLALLKRLGVPGAAAVLSNVKLIFADDDFLAVVRGVKERLARARNKEPERVELEPRAERVHYHDDEEVYTRD